MPEVTELVWVYDDDGEWEGYYLNCKLVIEGHWVDARQLLRALGIELKVIECDGQWLEENGTLPGDLADVKKLEIEPEEEE